MIRYALACDKGHSFESWFQDSAAYDKQAKRKLIACPHCGSVAVDKAIMAPRLSATKKRGRPAAISAPAAPAPPAAPAADRTRRAGRARCAGRGQGAGRHAVAAGKGIPRQAEGIARPPHQECRPRRAEISRGSA
jgi:hypothetical protein